MVCRLLDWVTPAYGLPLSSGTTALKSGFRPSWVIELPVSTCGRLSPLGTPKASLPYSEPSLHPWLNVDWSRALGMSTPPTVAGPASVWQSCLPVRARLSCSLKCSHTRLVLTLSLGFQARLARPLHRLCPSTSCPVTVLRS